MNTENPTIHTDALGNNIVIGNWYGYSRNDSGWSHVTLGIASRCKDDKVFLEAKKVSRYLYGEVTDFRAGSKLVNVWIRSNMVFPVAPQVP